MRKIREKLSKRKSASHSCRTKSTKTQWQMRKRKQNFRDCRLEKKEESQAVECYLETMVEQIFALGKGARDENAENAPIYFAPELFSYCVFFGP